MACGVPEAERKRSQLHSSGLKDAARQLEDFSVLFFCALHVLLGLCVHPDLLARRDEERYVDHRAGTYLSGLRTRDFFRAKRVRGSRQMKQRFYHEAYATHSRTYTQGYRYTDTQDQQDAQRHRGTERHRHGEAQHIDTHLQDCRDLHKTDKTKNR